MAGGEEVTKKYSGVVVLQQWECCLEQRAEEGREDILGNSTSPKPGWQCDGSGWARCCWGGRRWCVRRQPRTRAGAR